MSQSDVRTLGLMSPKGTGKTSLVEAMLFNAKASARLGRVQDGNTVSDNDPEEIERKMSLFPTVCSFEYAKKRMHVVDTAGYPDFMPETKQVAHAVDNILMVVSAADGVKSQAIKIWNYAGSLGSPRSVFVTEIDKDLADFDACWDSMRKMLESAFVPITVPMVEGKKVLGVIDVVKMKALSCKDDGSGACTEGDIPEGFKDFAGKYRDKLVETVAETDDSLMEVFLEGGELTAAQVVTALGKAAAAGSVIPVYSGSLTLNVGVTAFMDYFAELSASPDTRPEMAGLDKDDKETTRKPHVNEPFSAFVFKTMVDQFVGRISIFRVVSGKLKADSLVMNSTKNRKEKIGQIFYICGKKQTPAGEVGPGDIAAVVKMDHFSTGDTLCDPMNIVTLSAMKFPEPVLSLAIKSKERGDEDKLGVGLGRLQEEDPLLKLQRNEQTKELTMCGTGAVHLDAVVKRLKARFAVEVEVSTPKVPYRETISKAVKYVEYTHKKQSGGAGQYAKVFIDLEPMERGGGYEFVDKIFGGVIDNSLRPSVNKGILARLPMGIVAGCPVTDVRVSLVDGKTHPVDSKDVAFQVAGRQVFKKAFLMADPILLEPVMNVEIEVPDECMGDIIGDVNTRRGRVGTVDQGPGGKVIKALIPLAEMLRYAPDLDSMTSGRGVYSMELSHYDEVPKKVANEIIEKHAKQKADEED